MIHVKWVVPTDSSALAIRLAAQILTHARRQGLSAGAHVTEQSLADAFRVSRSPIRAALALLARQGVLVKQTNRGYFLKALPEAKRAEPVAPTSESDERYLRIADDRLAGRVDDHVTETQLMQRYGMGRREVQRILHRMEREGWAERKAGHGWRFAALADNVDAHAEGYRFRMLLEPAALLEPGFRVVAPELERVRRDQQMLLDGGIHRLSRATLFEIGSDFHETIMAFSGNRFILEAIRRVNATRRLLEYRAKYDRERLAGQCREHLQLIELLRRGAREEAARFLRKHLDVVRALKTEPERHFRAAITKLAAQF
ncbi:MAG: GntR family transcriptional regulator [Burkholderiales bacterium]|nr:GntR family transcriptional regulator [Burkholderiales bacterium]